jgi:hypothetical protein
MGEEERQRPQGEVRGAKGRIENNGTEFENLDWQNSQRRLGRE